MSINEKLVPGMVLGRYELLLPVAQGGMATVWAARQRGTRGFNKTVAIKTMLPALSDDPMFEQMFLDEAALAAKIHHPNVAEILDLGEQDEVLYIVMEWIEGEALSVLYKMAKQNQAKVPLRLSLRVVHHACAALHAAHELRDEDERPLRLVHRDVSPQNILCTYDGIVKLVDFGVAKAVGRAGGETTAGQLKGKVPYMSPEQARGGEVDRRTDIFALGIVMYKLATGLHPFMGADDITTMRNIISRPLVPPRLKLPTFPQEVEQIIIKCLQKDPEKRYQTMAELGLAVERALAGMGPADDDLGAFVRSTMGDRGAKRRAAIRDAVRTADERYATGQHPLVTVPAPPTIHENASDAALTRMKSEVQESILTPPRSSGGGELSQPSVVTPLHDGGDPHTPSPASTSWPGSLSVRPEAHSGTDQAVIVALTGPRKRPGLLLGGAAATILAVAGALFVLSGTGRAVKGKRTASASQGQASLPTSLPAGTVAVASPPPTAPSALVAMTDTAVSAAAPATPPATASATSAPVPTVAWKGKNASPPTAFKGPLPGAKPEKPEKDEPAKMLSGDKTIYTTPGF